MTKADPEMVAEIRAQTTKTEQLRMKTLLETGVFHLQLAREAFAGLDSDLSDLDDFREEADTALATVTAALAEGGN